MRNTILKISVILLIIFNSSFIWAQNTSININNETEKTSSIETYLAGYIDHNLELKQLMLNVQEAEADLLEFNINNGVNLDISTGNSTITFSESDTELTTTPSITLSLPDSRNTSITTSAPLTITTGDTPELSLDDAGVIFSTDIISSTTNTNSLTKEKYQRIITEANQAVNTKKVSLQVSFWEDVRDIYSADLTIKTNSEDLYNKQIELDAIKAKGYAETSSKYRTAELELKEAEFTVKKNELDLKKLLGDFAVSCGFRPESMTELPVISEKYFSIELVSFDDYFRENFIDLEKVVWNHEYNNKLRDAKSDITLSVNAGYGYSALYGNTTSDIANKISTGVTATYKGLTASLGLSTELEEISEPSITFSFSYNFGTTKLEEVYDILETLDEKAEQLDIDSAIESWIEYRQETSSNKDTLQWTRTKNAEQLKLYKEMYEDSINWYESGNIPKTDLLQAENSYKTKIDDSIITIIDCILYNIEIEKLFIGEI